MNRSGLIVAGIFGAVVCAAGDGILVGAGATFPEPLYQHWIEVYKQQTTQRISYKGVGSGTGIRLFLENQKDFGGTDAFLTDREIPAGRAILHIPTCIGAVALTYNLPGNPRLNLSPEVLVDIIMGKITHWQDKRLQNLNRGLRLPKLDMKFIHRSDGSGTTRVLTDYLSAKSQEWSRSVGSGTKVTWPRGMGAEGNPGIAQAIKTIPGSIGYVEMTYARQGGLPTAHIANTSGRFVQPTPESAAEAAAGAAIPDDTRAYITDSPSGYPISALSWIICYQEQKYDQRTRAHAQALADWLWWVVQEGQEHNTELYYAPLPEPVIKKAARLLQSLNYAGTPLLGGPHAP